MASGTWYLRPTSDISVGHTKIPADSEYGYTLINEEVSDGSTTALALDGVSGETVTATSSFLFSGIPITENEFIIKSINISGYATSNMLMGDSTSEEYLNFTISSNGISWSSGDISINFVYDLDYVNPLVDNPEMLNMFNEYAHIHKKIPDVTVTVTSKCSFQAGTGKMSSTSQSIVISQLYLAIAYDPGIFRKVSGSWKRSKNIFKKINNIWTEIDDGMTTVQSNLIESGHNQFYLISESPTCTTDGKTEGYKCNICGEVFVPQNNIPALGHNYISSGEYNVCTRCQHVEGIGHVELAYNSTDITPLSVGRYYPAATTVGNYALFAGGNTENNVTASVDAYDTSLTRTSATELNVARYKIGATTVGNYALFAGGLIETTGTNATSTVDAYDTSLTRSNANNIISYSSSTYIYNLGATTIGNYAIFSNPSGGRGYMNVYNTSLTQSCISGINTECISNVVATTVGNYAIFAGGGTSDSVKSGVDAFDSSLTASSLDNLSLARKELTATSVGNYALFAGGDKGNNAYDYIKSVDAYDTSLTRTSATELNVARSSLSATTICIYAIFGGGVYYDGSAHTDNPTIDVYDVSLTKILTTSFNSIEGYTSSTTVGNYAIFAGGGSDQTSPVQSNVEAYTFNVI